MKVEKEIKKDKKVENGCNKYVLGVWEYAKEMN
jgi:hypothetical protein